MTGYRTDLSALLLKLNCLLLCAVLVGLHGIVADQELLPVAEQTADVKPAGAFGPEGDGSFSIPSSFVPGGERQTPSHRALYDTPLLTPETGWRDAIRAPPVAPQAA